MRNYNDLDINYQSGPLVISKKKLTSLSGCPDITYGSFICIINDLTTLVGGPHTIQGDFMCSQNKLSDLIDGPIQVDGSYTCSSNQLTDLTGCPEVITGTFNCSENELSSLVGGPQQVDKNYNCQYNEKITNLIGCASHIGGELALLHCNITSLIGIHKIIKSCNSIKINDFRIKQGGIGLLMIANLIDIVNHNNPSDLSKQFKIIKKYLGQGTKGMMACSKELISNGYDEYAKL